MLFLFLTKLWQQKPFQLRIFKNSVEHIRTGRLMGLVIVCSENGQEDKSNQQQTKGEDDSRLSDR